MENKKKISYSIRTGKHQVDDELAHDIFLAQFLKIYIELKSESFFQKYLGYYCWERYSYNNGELGDIDHALYITLKKPKLLWPIEDFLKKYTEDDLFDIIEFLHDNCSKPIDEVEACISDKWDYSNDKQILCGYHHFKFDDKLGQNYFRQKINPLLNEYKIGFELTSYGEIVEVEDKNLLKIFDADIPTTHQEKLKIEIAVKQFRKRGASLEERKAALIELFGVLELLKKGEMKGIIDKEDETDLFNIANNFSLRHHNLKQKNNYDKLIFYNWIFYHLYATIHAVLRLIEKKKNEDKK